MYDAGGVWKPLTVAKESSNFPGEMGLFAAVDMAGGELVGYMLDGKYLGDARPGSAEAKALIAATGDNDKYVYELWVPGALMRMMDGEACRSGGPKRANDAKGLGIAANARLYDNGMMNVLPTAYINGLRANMTISQQKRCEILYDYGEAYWRDR